MQCLGIGSLLWSIECFKDPSKKTKISSTKLGNIIWGILNLIWGFALIWMFGYFLVFGDFPTGYNLSIWSIPISIMITCFC